MIVPATQAASFLPGHGRDHGIERTREALPREEQFLPKKGPALGYRPKGYRSSYILFGSHREQSPTTSPRIRAHSERVVLMHSGSEAFQVHPRMQQSILLPSS
jgi:hypothetical protein